MGRQKGKVCIILFGKYSPPAGMLKNLAQIDKYKYSKASDVNYLVVSIYIKSDDTINI